MAFKGCRGESTYIVRFFNFMSPGTFGAAFPGLGYSLLTGVSHSNRISTFTERGYADEGYADEGTAEIAKTGNNEIFLANAMAVKNKTGHVLSIDSPEGLTMPLQSANITLSVDRMRPFVTVLTMIAPSPD